MSSEPTLKKTREDALSDAEMHRMFPGYSPRPIDKRGEHS